MNAIIRRTAFRLAWLLPLAMPLAAMAQSLPAPTSSVGMAMPGMEPGGAHDPMATHAHHAVQPDDASSSSHSSPSSRRLPTGPAEPGSGGSGQHVMPEGMDPGSAHDMEGMEGSPEPVHGSADAMPDMQHTPASRHAMHDAMPHGAHAMRMQGGDAPSGARSADYSDGYGHGDMPGMDMRDAEPLGMLRLDQLEAFNGQDGSGQRWDLQAWYGTDGDRLWLRSEGERAHGRIDDGDAEALWSHAVATYWNTQLGVRHDFGAGPRRDWVAVGVQGLAPYWFELAATAYAGPSGRTAARLRVEYELLFTQRLILQPELELNLYGKADPQRRIGAGLSDASLGLRLRYEFSRRFAPYLGVAWTRRFGGTAGFARDEHRPVLDCRFVAGLRFWF
jgi:copper resistance protein B